MKLLYLFLLLKTAYAFYEMPLSHPFTWVNRIFVPTTNEELVKALCSTHDHAGHCNDEEPRIILITKIFDFRGSEGNATETGCYHWLKRPNCETIGQLKLDRVHQCVGHKATKVTYDKAGVTPVKVGSNKYIIGSNGGGLKGKGLNLRNSVNVFVYGISITDINARVNWGGDAFSLDNSTNIWVHNNYFARIGRQMLRSGPRPCRNITVSNNEFDGNTPFSAYCDGMHYWLWLFQGSDDAITLYQNYVHNTAGRGPHATGLNNTKVLLHILKNKFENVGDSGLVEAIFPTARLLIEGNTYNNVTKVVHINGGHIFYPLKETEASECKQYIGRDCYLNTIKDTGGLDFERDKVVLNELSGVTLVDTDKIDSFDDYFKLGETIKDKIYSGSKSKDDSCVEGNDPKSKSKCKNKGKDKDKSKDIGKDKKKEKEDGKSKDASKKKNKSEKKDESKNENESK